MNLKDEIKTKVGYIGINNPKTNGPWVATDRVTNEIVELCKQWALECVGEDEIVPLPTGHNNEEYLNGVSKNQVREKIRKRLINAQ